ADAGGRNGISRDQLIEDLRADAQRAYDQREAEVGPEVMRELVRRVVLSVLDRKWREHLYEMDYLREGIGLRAYSQRDPLVEYQREGFDMFSAMMEGIKEESVGFLFNLEVQVEDDHVHDHDHEDGEESECVGLEEAIEAGPSFVAPGLAAPQRPTNLTYTAPSEDGEAEVQAGPAHAAADDPYAGVSRNAECPCGSGKKFKKCHGAPGGPTGLS